MEPKADVVFEISYEVCNKVGGIYALLSSKAARIVEVYGQNYYAVGPYYEPKAGLEFTDEKPPEFLRKIFGQLEKEGIKCYFGKWLIPGRPNTILVDYSGLMGMKKEIKTKLWEDYGIDSLDADSWFDDPVIWSTAVGMLLDEIRHAMAKEKKKMVCHFHEWLCGGALLHVCKKVPTVFTTHATVLGRSVAGCGEDIHEEIREGLKRKRTVEERREYKYNVQAKHQMEKACARYSTVFTAVSETLADEAQYILGRRPDMVLPNGLDISKFPTMEEFAVLHRKYRSKIKDFLNAYFAPYYPITLWDCMIFFISGRYEFRNKGIDIFINALGKLNTELKKRKFKRNVFAFFLIPAGIRGENVGLLENVALHKDLKWLVQEEMPTVEEQIVNETVNTGAPENVRFRKEFVEECRRKMGNFKKKGTPPLCAFDLTDEKNDQIINALKENSLTNQGEDKVKVIFYPSYLSGSDRLLGLDLDQFVEGTHLGVFPSYYEAWGYTPQETAAHGVMSVTTDFAGFGNFIQKIDDKKHGIIVLKRAGKTNEEASRDLFRIMLDVLLMPREERINLKADAKELAAFADWKVLVENYVEAHNRAVK